MSTTPTNINLSDAQPAAKPGRFNAEWQGDVPVPDPNSPGNEVRNVSVCYRTPQVGGVFILDDSFTTYGYQLSDADCGQTLLCNSASPITIKFPATVPILPPAQGVWNVKIRNIGTGTITIDPNAVNLDGSTATFPLAQGFGFGASTDGAVYWTTESFDTIKFADGEVPSGTIDGSNTSFTLAHTPVATPIIEEDGLMPVRGAGSFGYTLTGTALVFTDSPQRSVHLWYRYLS